MMKIKHVLLFLFFAFASYSANAQAPEWSVNAVDYNYSMSFVGIVYLDNEKQADENSLIAAFIGDECRGVASPSYDDQTDSYNFFLLVYSDNDGDEVKFKYYSSDYQEISEFPQTAAFIADGLEGSPFTPYIWTNANLSEAKILSFELENQKSSEIVNNNINVIMPPEVDLSNLYATFDVSAGATVLVDNVIQISGTSAHDFTSEVIYVVNSGNNDVSSEYKINIMLDQIDEIKTTSLITANNDGSNDFWIVKDVEKYKEATFYILDSYGHTLFQSTGYDNSWNGTYQGNPLPKGTYYFVISTIDGRKVTGTISIIY